MQQKSASSLGDGFSFLTSRKVLWLLLLIAAIAIIAITVFITPKMLAAYYFNRGNTYLDQGQNTKAISDYTKAIQLDSQNELVY